jgi:hypothetical protein
MARLAEVAAAEATRGSVLAAGARVVYGMCSPVWAAPCRCA